MKKSAKSSDIKKFIKGDRVRFRETNEKGTVTHQFADGYVALTFDSGQPAWYDSESVERITTA